MKKSNLILFFLVMLAIASCTEANSQVTNLPLTEFVDTYKKTNNAQLLDVRTPGEWERGQLNSSKLINVNDSQFLEKAKELDKDKPLFVYCAAGVRSSKASKILSGLGFTVYNLTGAGYGQLEEKGL